MSLCVLKSEWNPLLWYLKKEKCDQFPNVFNTNTALETLPLLLGTLIKANYNWWDLPASTIEFKKLFSNHSLPHSQDVASLNSELCDFIKLSIIVSI